MLELKTIRQTAALGILTEHRLRLMRKQGLLPGIQTGNRFLVNVEALTEQLNKESRVAVAASAETREPA